MRRSMGGREVWDDGLHPRQRGYIRAMPFRRRAALRFPDVGSLLALKIASADPAHSAGPGEPLPSRSFSVDAYSLQICAPTLAAVQCGIFAPKSVSSVTRSRTSASNPLYLLDHVNRPVRLSRSTDSRCCWRQLSCVTVDWARTGVSGLGEGSQLFLVAGKQRDDFLVTSIAGNLQGCLGELVWQGRISPKLNTRSGCVASGSLGRANFGEQRVLCAALKFGLQPEQTLTPTSQISHSGRTVIARIHHG